MRCASSSGKHSHASIAEENADAKKKTVSSSSFTLSPIANPSKMLDTTRLAPNLYIGSLPLERVRGHFDVLVLCAKEWQRDYEGVHVIRAPLRKKRPARPRHVRARPEPLGLRKCERGSSRSYPSFEPKT